MKILYVCHKPPVPNVDGGTFAIRQFADALSDSAECDAFVMATHKHPYTVETENYLSEKFKVHRFEFIDTEIRFLPFLLSFLSRKSYVLQRFQSETLNDWLSKNAYDLIVCDSLFSLYAVRKTITGNQTKIWLRSHNVEFMHWLTASKQQSAIKKELYKIQAKQLRREELELVKNTDLNLCISAEDERMFRELIPGGKTTLLPVHVDTNPGLTIQNRECYFLGSPNWDPNIETVNYLLDCWKDPAFQKHSLTIAGGFDKSNLKCDVPDSVQLAGRINELHEFMSDHGILVAPSFSGSGIKVKILEALGAGVAVITTKQGATGISEESGLIIIENKEQLLSAIDQLKSDADYFSAISESGKSYIQKKHSFAVVKEIITEALGE